MSRALRVILWTNLALTPVELLFDAIEPNWSVAASSYERVCPTPSLRKLFGTALLPERNLWRRLVSC